MFQTYKRKTEMGRFILLLEREGNMALIMHYDGFSALY